MVDIDHFTTRIERRSERIPLAPDPESRQRHWPFVSVDDHLMEPGDLFLRHLPAHLRDRAPRVIEDDTGMEYWQFEDELAMISGFNVPKSWEPKDMYGGPVRYDEMRRGAWDVDERVRDMDLGGIYASLCFPSMVFGFAGWRFMQMKDPELRLECLRAYNRWMIEDWVGAHPDRFIPAQVTCLWDVEQAAAEVRANADRGFHSVTFSENPEGLGLPSLYTDYWDPFFAACQETGTVINLHVGSSGSTALPSKDSPNEVLSALFTISALSSAVDWVYTKIPVRFPDLKLVLSEGGIGWLPMLLDRLEYIEKEYVEGGMTDTWDGVDLSPRDVLLRNFWFTAYYDPRTVPHLEQEVLDHVMYESDYPHADSSWPNTHRIMRSQFEGLPTETVEKMTFRTACELFRHPMPDTAGIEAFIADGAPAG